MKPLLLAFISILYFFDSFAQTNQNEYSVTWLNTTNGLKQATISDCAIDKNDIIWIATQMGLYRYDGTVLKDGKSFNQPQLNGERIKGIHLDASTGSIFLNTYPSLYEYKISNDEVLKLPKPLPDTQRLVVYGIDLLRENKISTKIIQHPKFKNYLYQYNKIESSGYNTNEYLYLFIKDSIVIFNRNGELKAIPLKLERYNNNQFLTHDKRVLYITKNKLYLFENDRFLDKELPQIDEVMKSALKAGINQGSEYKIFKTNNNCFLVHNEKVYRITFSGSHLYTTFLFNAPAKDISCINYNSKDDIYFIGTFSKGLALLRNNPVAVIKVAEKSSDWVLNVNYAVRAITANIWYSCAGWKYDFLTKKILKLPRDNISNLWQKTIIPYKGSFYINNFRNKQKLLNISEKINSRNDLMLSAAFIKDSLPFNSYTYLNDQLWMCTDNKIGYVVNDTLIENKTFTLYHTKGKLNQLCAFNNKILIATSEGVLIYEPNKKIKFISGLEKYETRYLKIIDSVSFWVGCYGQGLFLVHNNIAYKVTDKNLDITTAHAIEEDKQENLWISTNNGLLMINKKNAILNTLQKKSIHFYRFTTEYGLPTNEFNGGCTPSSLQDSAGRIGFPSMNGFVWFYPEKLIPHAFTGNIVFNTVSVKNNNCVQQQGIYQIPSNANNINIDISIPYYYSKDNISVEYKSSIDTLWSEVVNNNINLPRTQSGEIEIMVRVVSKSMTQAKAVTAHIKLFCQPKLYENLWFQQLAFIVVFAFIVGIILITSSFYKKREVLLNEKVAEKTSQLNNTVEQLQTSLSQQQKLEKSRSQFFGIIAHDLRSPINTYSALTENMNYLIKRQDYHRVSLLANEIDFTSRNLAVMINNLLNWSVQEQGLMKVNLSFFNLNELMQELLPLYQSISSYKEIRLQVSSTEAKMYSDKNMVAIILRNLIDNAIKNGIPTTDVTINYSIVNELLHINICNAFEPKATNKLQRIAEIINSGVIATLGGEEGFGFGYILITRCLQQLGGKIEIRLQQSEVTTTVILPINYA